MAIEIRCTAGLNSEVRRSYESIGYLAVVRAPCAPCLRLTHAQRPALTLHEFIGGNGLLFRLRIRVRRSLDMRALSKARIELNTGQDNGVYLGASDDKAICGHELARAVDDLWRIFHPKS